MEHYVLVLLLGILNLLGRVPEPASIFPDWNIVKTWEPQGEYYVFEASSRAVVDACKSNLDQFIVFPQVIHGVHEIYGDGALIQSSGDTSFKKASPFYHQAFVSCREVSRFTQLTWRVTSYSLFFSRFLEPIKFSANANRDVFYNGTANTAAAGILLILAAFAALIYYRRVSDNLTYSVVFGAILFSGYFIFSENSDLGITLSMLECHKLADTGLWLGAIMILNAFTVDGLLSKPIFRIQLTLSAIAIVVILFGSSGDMVQFGTTIPMMGFLFVSTSFMNRVIHQLRNMGLTRNSVMNGVGMLSILIFGLNDILHIFTLNNSYMLLPFGLVGGIFGLSLAVNNEIENTYLERDGLLKNLDNKVKEKTAELQEALVSLKSTQSELVHSAKLASLGTLSAGIAHEINNSINYVNGALVPLERKIHALIPVEQRVMVDKLLASIKEGTSLTIEIVKSLRTYTGLNHADFKRFPIKDSVDSVLTILKSKLRGFIVKLEIEENLSLTGNLIGINQVFMNLISNAIDVLPAQNGEICIGARTENALIRIWVQDNGCGIPPEKIARIFDPFFTTKEVGKGTGLGLHIVQQEIEKHHGKITVTSQVNQGTRFEITVPQESGVGTLKREAA